RCLFLCSAPPPSEVYTLSLHDALPIYVQNLVASSKSPNISSHVSAHPEPIPSLRVSINCVKVLTLVAASIMDSSSPNFFMVSRNTSAVNQPSVIEFLKPSDKSIDLPMPLAVSRNAS